MAFRRSVTARAKLLYQQQRVALPFSHTHPEENDHENLPRHDPIFRNSNTPNYFQRRSFGAGNSLGNFYRSRKDHGFVIPVACSLVAVRNMSSRGEGPSDKIEIMTDMADVLGDKAVEVTSQVSPVVNEVAVAASDSFFPVAALQYLIDYVHTFTGFNWWASIIVTTILIRTLQLPLMINQQKSISNFTLIRPRLQEIKEEMQSRDMSPAAVAEGQARMKELFKEYGVTPLTPFKGIFIVGPVFCCFFLAIRNMAENVQSFKEGGAWWFTDLATPDPSYTLPILTALTFWITVECNAQEGMEGNPAAGTIKNMSRIFAALTIPVTATFPKAMFFYWITSNIYSLAYGLALKNPQLKKKLGIPITRVQPPSGDQKDPSSFSKELSDDVSTKPAADHRRIPSSSVLSQRIKMLEKEVKGRKKGTKR